MAKLRLRPYAAGDHRLFTPRADFAEEHEAMGWPLDEARPEGEIWTLVGGDQVLGVGGVAVEPDGPWMAWAYLSDLPAEDWPQALWLARRLLDRILHDPACPGLEALSRIGLKGGIRTLKALGFLVAGVRVDKRLPGTGYRVMLRERPAVPREDAA